MLTFEEWTTLQSFLKERLFDKGFDNLQIWLPITDRESEGKWKDFHSNEVMENYTHPWIGSKPDGGTGENYARRASEQRWGDIRCDHAKYACACSYRPTSYLKLRGLCQNSGIDVFYKPINDWSDIRKMTLQGLTGTKITFDENNKIWNLKVAHSRVNATSKATHSSFLLGKQNWTITADENNECYASKEYAELKMSGCQKGEFTCNDGQCVGMEQRCNQLPDCRDKSDERFCKILILEDGYNMKVPPIQSDEPVNVSVSINLLKLVNIDEDDYSIEIQLRSP